MASVTAERLYREDEQSSEEHWWPQGLPNLGLALQNLLQRHTGQSVGLQQQHRECFPKALLPRDGLAASTSGRQELVTVGSRQWGHPAISSLLRVKIYDFAMYMDGQDAKSSRISKQYRGQLDSVQQDNTFYHKLRSSDDVSMALMVRASRNLPIKLLAGEYERILKRRLSRVGGSPDDAALAQMVDCFREETLPESIKHGNSVRKGTVLLFTKGTSGSLHARADEHDLITVQSQPLCRAVFDLYIGDQPVSRKAKRMAGDYFRRLVEAGEGDDEYEAPEGQLVCGSGGSVCEL